VKLTISIFKYHNKAVKIELLGEEMDNLLSDLIVLINVQPGLTGREYTRILRLKGYPNISKSEVNNNLYGYSNYFEPNLDDNFKPAWKLKNGVIQITKAISKSEFENIPLQHQNKTEINYEKRRPSVEIKKSKENLVEENEGFAWSVKMDLYPWQKRALNSWQENSYRGIVQAVTGSGKTRMALAAMEEHLKRGWKVAVIVPVIELMHQWDKSIREMLNSKLGNNYKIGYLGDGFKQNLQFVDIVISTSIGAQKYNLLPMGQKGLLIADECHHYGTEKSIGILERRFTRRLGLTAWLEREDNGVEKIIDPYFRNRIPPLGYREAFEDKVISPFDITFISTEMYDEEREQYDKCSTEINRLTKKLKNKYPELAEDTGESFFTKLNKFYGGDKLTWAYIKQVSLRTQMLVDLKSKLDVIPLLLDAIESSNGCFGFTQTVAGSKSLKDIVSKNGIKIEIMEGGLDKELRRDIFKSFETKGIKMITAPKLLDEGIDVPTADLAIITGMSKSKRQIIQRVGRVIRKKQDKGHGRIIIIISNDTIDDPKVSKTEANYSDFIDENIKISRFDLNEDMEKLQKYLETWKKEKIS
jgi:RNA polymerase primary sigma factor